MKKIDVDAVEKFAKEKNIDKNKIEEIAESYQGKSQDELMVGLCLYNSCERLKFD